MTFTFEARGFPKFFQLGHLAVLIEREVVPAKQLISRPQPGAIYIDIPGFSIILENGRRFDQHIEQKQQASL